MPFAADFLHPSFTFWSDFGNQPARNVSHQWYVDLCYIFGTRNLQFIVLAFFLHFSCIFLWLVKCIYASLIYFSSGWAQVWQATANRTYEGYRKFAGGNFEKIRNCWNLSLIFYVTFLYSFLLSLERHVGISHWYDNGFGEPCLQWEITEFMIF